MDAAASEFLSLPSSISCEGKALTGFLLHPLKNIEGRDSIDLYRNVRYVLEMLPIGLVWKPPSSYRLQGHQVLIHGSYFVVRLPIDAYFSEDERCFGCPTVLVEEMLQNSFEKTQCSERCSCCKLVPLYRRCWRNCERSTFSNRRHCSSEPKATGSLITCFRQWSRWQFNMVAPV